MSAPESPPRATTRSASLLPLVAIIVAGTAVRSIAARGDLWFDELWSLSFARQARNALDVFSIAHDNNHFTNTLWLYGMGTAESPLLQRLPSIVSGTLTLWFGATFVRATGARTALPTATLLAVSYPLIHYASEARGYALAVAGVLGGLRAWQVFVETGRTVPAVAAQLAFAVALLSHLTAAAGIAAAVVWRLVGLHRVSATPAALAREAVLVLTAPTGVALWVVLVHLPRLRIGGGEAFDTFQMARDTVELLSGASGLGSGSGYAAVGWLLVVGVSFLALGMAGLLPELALCAVGVGFLPLLVALRTPAFLAPRYFLMSLVFSLLAVGLALGRAIPRSTGTRLASAAILGVFVSMNGAASTELLMWGRGEYSSAISFMRENGVGDEITVGSDHDGRNRLLLHHYAAGDDLRPLRYVPDGSGRPEWFVTHRRGIEGAWTPPERTIGPSGNPYVLKARFHTGRLAGAHWAVYRSLRAEARVHRARKSAPIAD